MLLNDLGLLSSGDLLDVVSMVLLLVVRSVREVRYLGNLVGHLSRVRNLRCLLGSLRGRVLDWTIVLVRLDPLLLPIPWVEMLVLLEPEVVHLGPALPVRVLQELIWALKEVWVEFRVLFLSLVKVLER